MAEEYHIIGYTISNTLEGSVFLWDHDYKQDELSKPQNLTLLINWLEDTGWIGWVQSIEGKLVGIRPGPYQCLRFKDRESKVLFKMAFNVP